VEIAGTSVERGRLIEDVLASSGLAGKPLVDRAKSDLGPSTTDVVGFVLLLTESLGDRDPAIRHTAAEMLGRFAANGLPRHTPSLGEALPTAVTALAEALHDTVPSVRVVAAEAAGHWGPGARRLVPRLSLSAEDPNTEVREAAVRSIGKLGRDAPSDAVEALARIVGQANRRPAALVELAIRQLTNCGPDAAGSASAASAAVLADCRFDLSMRLAAAETLRWLGPESATVVDQLVEVLIAGPPAGDEQVRTVAAAALVSTAVDPAGVAQRVRDAAQRDRLIEALRRVGPGATEFRRGVQAQWNAPPSRAAHAIDAPTNIGSAGRSPDHPATPALQEAGTTGDANATSSGSFEADNEQLAALAVGVAEIKARLESQQQSQPVEKEWYTVKEAAEQTDYSAWTLRQACNTGRIEGEKGVDGKWRVSHETIVAIRNHGLPPNPRPEQDRRIGSPSPLVSVLAQDADIGHASRWSCAPSRH